MDNAGDAGLDNEIGDAVTTPNIKVVARDWLALEALLVKTMEIEMSRVGRFPAADDHLLQAPGGKVDQWLEFSRLREEAAAEMLRRSGSLYPPLLPYFYPSFNPLVLQFMAKAIAVRGTKGG